jgi:phosphatidylserine synthase
MVLSLLYNLGCEFLGELVDHVADDLDVEVARMLAGELVGQADDLAALVVEFGIMPSVLSRRSVRARSSAVALTNTVAPYPPLTARQSPPRKLGP